MSKKILTEQSAIKSFSKPIIGLILLLAFTTVTKAGDPVNVSLAKNDIHDVRIQAEYDGTVVVHNAAPEQDQQKETVLPIQVRARLQYEQQMLSSRYGIRHYTHANSDVVIDQKKQVVELDANNRNVSVFLGEGKSVFPKPVLYSSELDILRQREYEMIATPFDFVALPSFLRCDDAEINEAWHPEDQHVVNVLAIDLLYTNDVNLMVKSVTAEQTKIYITGRATGQVDGEDVQFDLSGVALIDNAAKIVKALRITINENRVAGQIAPGFEGTVKIDMRSEVKSETEVIPSPVLARASKFRPQKLAWKPDNQFKLYFDPRWRMIISEDQAAVLRLIEEGDLLAQCNAVQLPNRPADNLLTLKEFTNEVRNMFDGEEAKLVDSSESQSSRGLSLLRADIKGVQDEVAVRWVYYHVAHNDGRRLTFMFSVEEEVYERFQPYSQQLVDALVFKRKTKSTARKSAPKTSSRR